MLEAWKSRSSLQTLKQRAFLMEIIRTFFKERNVLEVETPILSSFGNTDTCIESFTTQKINPEFDKAYLRTSPEFPLKRLLCDGVGDIFELAKVFRQEEVSKRHNCEFTLLEWYRINFTYNDLIQEVIEFIECIFLKFKLRKPRTEILTYHACFRRYLNLDLSIVESDGLINLCTKQGYMGSTLSRQEACDFLFASVIEAQFDPQSLTFVTHYPATQAALAQINPEDDLTCLRFEVFYNGQELGNGYQELTDSAELKTRFQEDNSLRKSLNLPQVEIDEHLLAAMNSGLPKCSGIAMGVDRLLMTLIDAQSIDSVISFDAQNS